MKLKRAQITEDEDASIQLDIIRHPNITGHGKSSWGSPTFFEPQREPIDQTPTASRDRNLPVPAPEKKLTLFALRLAILEKAASGLGALGFVWATVVLLGGFASSLQPKDFWIITGILVIEGTRIFSRSHELEWQHQATTWSLTSASRYSFRALVSGTRWMLRALVAVFRPSSLFSSGDGQAQQISTNLQTIVALKRDHRRTWHSSDVPILPYAGWAFLSRNVSRAFYWLQLISALACTVLSLMRLSEQDYGEVSDDTKNRSGALNMFYALALAEALMFLMEKAYWHWKVEHCKLLEKVCRGCDLGSPHGMASIKRFFYDSYSKCIDGSIFDGLKMDLVSFGAELLNSNSWDEQLIGAQLLQKFATNAQFGRYTLRKIGTSIEVIERLIEMLNWKSPEEEEIRRAAAEIVSKLAGGKQNAIRVAEIPGAMESISSLLYTGESYDTRQVDTDQHTEYDFSVFNLLGLLILKKLAGDHENCYKIGNARGLMPKIIGFTSASESLLRDVHALESEIMIVKHSLQLLKILVSTTGQTGKMLRKEISEIVFTVSNVRDILQYGESHMVLQKLGIDVLTSLAMDEEARERIGSTGGVIKLLLSIFFKPRLTEEQNSVSAEAGEALALLAFESGTNCQRILKEKEVVWRLISSLDDNVLQVNASRILRNLCAYSSAESSTDLTGVITAAPMVLKAIMYAKDKLLEVSIGLAAQIFRFITPEEFVKKLGEAGAEDAGFAKRLVEILTMYNKPEIKVPRIRRFAIELAIWLMRFQGKYVQLFKDLGADEVLQHVAETTSELESYNVFSGSVGLGRNAVSLSSLVDTAFGLMNQK